MAMIYSNPAKMNREQKKLFDYFTAHGWDVLAYDNYIWKFTLPRRKHIHASVGGSIHKTGGNLYEIVCLHEIEYHVPLNEAVGDRDSMKLFRKHYKNFLVNHE